MATFDFSTKVVIVTGSSSGLGQATAILFARAGASVTLCGRDEDRLEAARQECVQASGGHGQRFIGVPGDVTFSTVRQAIVDKTIAAFGKLDILVANAGSAVSGGSIVEATEQTFDSIFDSNVKSVFFLIQAALPHLEKTGGNVITISSICSIMPLGRSVLYPMTKATVDHMTKCLGLDLAPKGVRVNAVNPSYVPTRIHRAFGDADVIAKMAVEKESRKQPLYGECVTAEAIANAVAFLASDAAKYITGQCHFVDGARHVIGPFCDVDFSKTKTQEN